MTTTIQYIDFEPRVLEKSFWGTHTYETVDATLERANEWIRRHYSKEIVNVETVILPNIYTKGKAQTNQTTKYPTGGSIVQTFQIIRIWYKG
ncbi:hypothetical protein AAU57_12270 [Nonlabens sp. YIK11]|uniref:hypothetical protein n=1 Tax=Nonlabens sp. YIK11 TaxID=1453349 RepID=UPI0006DD204D|nr:hypothetical protein [Nonlabens sp. YIK11]KQC34020.1 hypothetical protein AAU57_12270 [Nonlabens sp. YIK11]